jgi:UDP-3-O-[3-hydroxymyristoyl] glucosamine N-acyltransferase
MNEKVLTVRTLARHLEAKVIGDESVEIHSPGGLDCAGPGQVTFALDERRARQLKDSRASAAVVPASVDTASMTLLQVENPELAWAQVLHLFAEPATRPPAGIHPLAHVDDSAQVAEEVSIGPHCVVGPGAKIGQASVLHPGAVVESEVQVGRECVLHSGVVVRYRCRLGDRVEAGPNSVIGHDGFGYYFHQGAHHKVDHIGNVVIEDDVELGACVCVDRAKFGSTRIGAGSKVDNLVQIAHNVDIGPGSILVGQCGIAGSARLGKYVMVGGSSGVRDNIRIGDQAKLAAYSAAAQDIPDGQTYAGTPAGPASEVFRQHMALQKLPDLLKRLKKLEARLQELESSNNH